ncbi:hypothetical protein Bca4012_019959 [Brassica carinata]
MGPSSSQKLRRSNREEEYVKVIEWKSSTMSSRGYGAFFCSQISHGEEAIPSPQTRLAYSGRSSLKAIRCVLRTSSVDIVPRNELEEMRQRLEARKMLVEKTSFACKVTEQDVKTKEESLSAEVRSLLVGGTTLSIAKSKLQELNCQLEGESSYTHLKIVTNKLRKRQQYMVSQVSFIYPLKIEAGPSQDQELESLPQEEFKKGPEGDGSKFSLKGGH